MVTFFGKRGIAVRAIKITKILKLISLSALLSFCLVSYAETQSQKGLSQAEIVEIKRISENAVNDPTVKSWVSHVGKNTISYIKKNSTQDKLMNQRATVMILVSSSMPASTIHRYLLDASKINASIVLRGLVNNSLQDTGRFIHLALDQLKSGVSIDPVVFEKLHIDKVPVIILFNQSGLNCLNTQDCTVDTYDYDAVYGHVTLEYALSVMAERGSANQIAVKSLLKVLRNKDAV